MTLLNFQGCLIQRIDYQKTPPLYSLSFPLDSLLLDPWSPKSAPVLLSFCLQYSSLLLASLPQSTWMDGVLDCLVCKVDQSLDIYKPPLHRSRHLRTNQLAERALLAHKDSMSATPKHKFNTLVHCRQWNVISVCFP